MFGGKRKGINLERRGVEIRKLLNQYDAIEQFLRHKSYEKQGLIKGNLLF